MQTPSLLVLLLLTSCHVTQPRYERKTSLEIQAIQIRIFDTNKGTAFRSVLSVLQDFGYIVQTANLETGIITVQSPTRKDVSGAAEFAAIWGGVRTENQTCVTSFIEDLNERQTKVRLNFVEKRFRNSIYGQQATDETPLDEIQVYKNTFDKIGETIFIRETTKKNKKRKE